MKVTKKTESIFEVEFDADDQQQLEDIEDICMVPAKEVIERSINESLRLGVYGVRNLMRVVTKRKGPLDGDSGSTSS